MAPCVCGQVWPQHSGKVRFSETICSPFETKTWNARGDCFSFFWVDSPVPDVENVS